jgi:hypothetical protein
MIFMVIIPSPSLDGRLNVRPVIRERLLAEDALVRGSRGGVRVVDRNVRTGQAAAEQRFASPVDVVNRSGWVDNVNLANEERGMNQGKRAVVADRVAGQGG